MTTDVLTMRAVSQDRLGGPEVLREIELERPTAGPGQILVRVRAAGVNPSDWVHRKSPGALLPEPPFVLGWDVAGLVEAIGLGVTLFQPGNEVFGMLPYPHGHGSYAEYVVGPARAFVRKPHGVDHIQAGAIPLAGLTAWQALVDTARVQPGQRVLIHAAAGGVGHFAVQIAKARGAYVIGTASEGKHGFLRSLGVDEPIDYRTTELVDAVRNVDIVLDAVGGETALQSMRVLRPAGLLVTIRTRGAKKIRSEAERLGMRAQMLLVEADHAGMAAIAELVEHEALRPHIAATFPLADAGKAHAIGETGRTIGKLVLTV
jgi:NADPH:quinone reductase-like Zn-dependent oxidoreductase